MKSLNNFSVENSRVEAARSSDLSSRPLVVADEPDNNKPNKPVSIKQVKTISDLLAEVEQRGEFL